jgi:phage replication O-like protein O
MSITGTMIYPDGESVGRYSTIGDDILEKVADIELTRAERKVLDRIIRDTVGYEERKAWTGQSVRRVTHELPIKRFIEKTLLPPAVISEALDKLEQKNIIERNGDSITFNHHVDRWRTGYPYEL